MPHFHADHSGLEGQPVAYVDRETAQALVREWAGVAYGMHLSVELHAGSNHEDFTIRDGKGNIDELHVRECDRADCRVTVPRRTGH